MAPGCAVGHGTHHSGFAFVGAEFADAGFMEGFAAVGVVGGRGLEVGEFAVDVHLVEAFEYGDAPVAAGAGAEAFGDEGCDGWVFALEEGADLPEGDVEAEADLVVGGHDREV